MPDVGDGLAAELAGLAAELAGLAAELAEVAAERDAMRVVLEPPPGRASLAIRQRNAAWAALERVTQERNAARVAIERVRALVAAWRDQDPAASMDFGEAIAEVEDALDGPGNPPESTLHGRTRPDEPPRLAPGDQVRPLCEVPAVDVDPATYCPTWYWPPAEGEASDG